MPQNEEDVGQPGFWSGLLGAPDNIKVDPNTGMTEAQRQQSLYGTIGSLGALLLAAGQKQMPADRAKYLAQIGGIPAQMSQQQAVMQQAQLRQAQMQKLKVEMDQMKAWQALINGTGPNATASAAAARAPIGATMPTQAAANPPSPPEQPPAGATSVLPPSALLRAGNNPPVAPVAPTAPVAAGNPSGATTGPTLNSPTIPNIVSRMDPYSRAALGSLGASAGPQLLLKESFDTAGRNQQIQATKELEAQKAQTKELEQQRTQKATPAVLSIYNPETLEKYEFPTTQWNIANGEAEKAALAQFPGFKVGKLDLGPGQQEALKGNIGDYRSAMEKGLSAGSRKFDQTLINDAVAGLGPIPTGPLGEYAAKYASILNPLSQAVFGKDIVPKENVANFQILDKTTRDNAIQQASANIAMNREGIGVINAFGKANVGTGNTEDAIRRLSAIANARADYDEALGLHAAKDENYNNGSPKKQFITVKKEFSENNPLEGYLAKYMNNADFSSLPEKSKLRLLKTPQVQAALKDNRVAQDFDPSFLSVARPLLPIMQELERRGEL